MGPRCKTRPSPISHVDRSETVWSTETHLLVTIAVLALRPEIRDVPLASCGFNLLLNIL